MKHFVLAYIFWYPALFLSAGSAFTQNSNFENVQQYISDSKLDSAFYYLNKIKTKNNSYERGLINFYNGIISVKKDKHDKAFKEFILAKEIFVQLDSLQDKADCNYEIYDLLTHQKKSDIDSKPYLDEYVAYAKSANDPLTLARAYSKLAEVPLDNNDLNTTVTFYNKSIEQLVLIKDTLRINLIEFNKGIAYNILSENKDSAFYYFRKTLPYFQENNLDYFTSINYNNQARAYENIGNYEKAIEYYQKTDNINLEEFDIKTRAAYYKNQLESYSKTNDFENAYKVASKLLEVNDSINETKQNIEISSIKEQFDNEKLRADNLEIEAQRLQNRNFLIATLGLLFFVTVIGYLINRNSKRKQHIAEQEKALEVQKKEKLLKDQELNAIDAMINGQEKERQRLASDLHDSVGATLSAAKLQFDHLSKNKGQLENLDELFIKTGALLDEAYTEVRSMAHLKNSGVIAKKGLLPAVEKLAKNASNTNGLTIEVQDFGLTEKLEGSLEIAIFRMIQELVTNIIKHAYATEAVISITQHEHNLSIIVEDNGKGFDANHTEKKEGMGLSSIEKRVEHLEGSMEVDASPGRGTNILIDIPI